MFMNQIGLQLENSVQNIIVKELHWDGCLEDRERRMIFDVCFEKLTDNLEPLTKQKWLRALSEETLNGGLQLDDLNLSLRDVIINHCLIDRDTLLNAIEFGRLKSLNRSGVNSGDNVNKAGLRSPDDSQLQLTNGQSLISLLRKIIRMDRKPTLNQFGDVEEDPVQFKWPVVDGVEIVTESIREHFKSECLVVSSCVCLD